MRRSSLGPVIKDVLGAPAVQAEAAGLAAQLGLSTGDAEEKLEIYLRLLVPSQEERATRLLHAISHPVVCCWNLQAERSAAAELRRLAERHPLVFLPAHRCYADPMVLATTLRAVGLPPTVRFTGDTMAFWPIGHLGRRAGSVFIRRSLAGDPLYALAVRSYLRYAVRHGYNLEWYPEGGRSRTGRLRPFQHDLIRDLVDVLDDSPSGDAYVVPVTIAYELLPDAERLVAEDAGLAKRRWLFGQCRTSRRLRGGRAWICFGTPFSVRECTGPSPTGRSTDAIGVGCEAAETPTSGWRATRAVGAELARQLQAATPVTPSCLLILLLNGGHREPRDVWQIMRELKPLMAFISDRSIPAVNLHSLTSQGEVQRALGRLMRAGAVTAETPRPTSPRRYRIGPEQAHLAAFYQEQAAHWFVPRAIAELVLATAADGTASAVESRALRLHAMLDGLIPLPEPAEFLEALRRELAAIGWTDGEVDAVVAPNSPTRLLAAQPFLLAHRLLGGPLEAALATATALAESDVQAERWQLPPGQGALTGRWPESRSRERWRAATIAADKATTGENAPAMDTADSSRERRRAYAAELAVLVHGLDMAADLDAHAAGGPPAPLPRADSRPVASSSHDASRNDEGQERP
ncbi:1-acyl-sn-glycerol-3-phosphate acyltransferase [Actinomadura sp. 6N118]|uniref:1-acyl-sn-glycerol-3-phosphate acyltransferase n=1 Tax=Actinomadura sp. 6N118 TaxID=3375151 RepID=UPI0037BA402B